MKTHIHIILLVVLFTLLTSTVTHGQDSNISLDAHQPLSISLTLEPQSDIEPALAQQVTLLVDLGLADALRDAGLSQSQIDAITLNPTVRAEAALGIAVQAQISQGEANQEPEIPSAKITLPEIPAVQVRAQLDALTVLQAVTVQATNLYSGPGEHFTAVAGAFAGDSLSITRRTSDGEWYQLDNDFWVAADAVILSGQQSAGSEASTALTVSTDPSADIGEVQAPLSTPAMPEQLETIATIAPTTNRDSNLRSGPGSNYPVAGQVKAGQVLTITGTNRGGDWYQLTDGTWISAFLVDNPPTTVREIDAPPPPYPTAPLPSS